jgi:hypothetical protein
MLQVLEVALAMALNIALPALLVRWDERRLSDLGLSRAWNTASFWSAIVAFGPLAVPVHFMRTRRSLLGFVLGLGALALLVAVQSAIFALLAALHPE